MQMTKIFTKNDIKEAAAELKMGELVAFPTETVYGLGADATNEKAVKRVYLAKGRPSDNPLIVTVSSIKMVERFVGEISSDAKKLMEKFWPGSLTIILNIIPGSLSEAVTGGLKTAAFRMPNNQVTLNLISELDRPLVGPSANSSGKPSPTTAKHVFHDLEGKISGIVDDGPATVGVESTIIDMSTDVPTILRPGAVTPESLEETLGKMVISDKHKVKDQETPKAPGMKYKHYAPNAQVLIVKDNDWPEALKFAQENQDEIAVLATDDILSSTEVKLEYSLGQDEKSAAKNLFAGLRYFDDMPQVKYILAKEFLDDGLGMAYMNRLKKSSGNQFFNGDLVEN